MIKVREAALCEINKVKRNCEKACLRVTLFKSRIEGMNKIWSLYPKY